MTVKQFLDRLQKGFVAAGVVLLSTVLLILVTEWAAGVALKKARKERPLLMLSYTDPEIRALYNTDQPDFYREVLAETWRMGETVYSPFVEYKMTPYRGRHYNITEQGFRPNGSEPQALNGPGRKIFVFGGSTALGSGVADQETIPAYLEQALRARGFADVQVFNFAVVSYFSTQERIAFARQLTAGQKPDVAVFIDGLNDFYYCTIPDQSSWNERLEQLTQARKRLPLSHEIAHRSNVVQWARHLGGDKSIVVREWGSFCKSESDTLGVIHRLDTNRRMLHGIAKELGIGLVLVHQPVPTWHYDNAKRPVAVQEEMLGYHANSARGYAAMQDLREKGALLSEDVLWLAELEPDANANAYIDTVHYSPRFNQAIAEAIAADIQGRGLLP